LPPIEAIQPIITPPASVPSSPQPQESQPPTERASRRQRPGSSNNQPKRRHIFSYTDTRVVEALYALGMTDAFIAMFLRRSRMVIVDRRLRMGLFRSFEDIRLGSARPRRPFRMTAQSRYNLETLEGPGWLCQCIDAFPKIVRRDRALFREPADHALGRANDSR
jgi:hypothetical protein